MRLAHHFISEIHFCRTLSGDRPQNFGENGKNSFSRHYDKPGGEVGGAAVAGGGVSNHVSEATFGGRARKKYAPLLVSALSVTNLVAAMEHCRDN